MPESIFFKSNGYIISAYLYLPENQINVPGLVMCHGFAGVKEMLLPSFAERFASNGYAVLVFDYRGFGDSEGEAGSIIPDLQIEDIINAITYMTTRPEINSNRIGLWGTSFGGANAIFAAARDVRICCLLVQLTFGNGERVIMHRQSENQKATLFNLIEKMQVRKNKTGKDRMVPFYQILADEQSIEFYKKNVKKFPSLEIKIPFLTIVETMKHKPEEVIGDLKVPIMIVAAEKDKVNPLEESKILFFKANEPKELVVIENATHYELYDGLYFEKVLSKQLEWLKKYL